MKEGPLERSGDGPYAELVDDFVESTRETSGSDPEVVATTVRKAVMASNPKARYAVGKFAKPLIALRRLGGDRIFDRVVNHML